MSHLHTTHKVTRDNKIIAWQWNAMLNQLAMDKENVPLALDGTHKATRDKKTDVPSGQCNWTNEWLKEAMDVVERMTHSLKRVSKRWNIFVYFLLDHLNGKTSVQNNANRCDNRSRRHNIIA